MRAGRAQRGTKLDAIRKSVGLRVRPRVVGNALLGLALHLACNSVDIWGTFGAKRGGKDAGRSGMLCARKAAACSASGACAAAAPAPGMKPV